MTSPAGLPGFPGLQLAEDHGTVQRYTAVDGEGLPITVLVLGEQASRDPRLRTAFVGEAVQASTAALPGELPISVDVDAPRPWAASHQQPGVVGVERLLPRVLGPAPPPARWAPLSPSPSRAPLGAALAAVALLFVVGIVTALTFVGGDEPVAAPTSETFPPLPTDLPTDLPPLPTVALPEPAPLLEGPPPALRDLPPVAVIGPVFPPGADTYTFAFDGWPFAFRGPSTWGCLAATASVPDSYAYLCIDEQNGGDGQRMTVMIRRCAPTCSPAVQEELNRAWLDEPDRAVAADPTTFYVETPLTPRGSYSVDFSHFFAEPGGGPPAWQVGVYVESPPETRDEVLMILNDIWSQTP